MEYPNRPPNTLGLLSVGGLLPEIIPPIGVRTSHVQYLELNGRIEANGGARSQSRPRPTLQDLCHLVNSHSLLDLLLHDPEFVFTIFHNNCENRLFDVFRSTVAITQFFLGKILF